MSRELEIGDEVLVPMIIVGFESQGSHRKSAVKVKLRGSKKKYDHRLTRSEIPLLTKLTWPKS